MSEWAPEGFAKSAPHGLKSAIARLSPSAKQAFHAAATRQTIRRKTWDGCAFNAGGQVLGLDNIQNYERAAHAFGMSVADVRYFIKLWDESGFASDARATKFLQEAIEEIGLFTAPTLGKAVFAGKTFVKVIHESDETREKRIFEQMVKDLEMDEETLSADMQEFKRATELAEDLLVCS